MGAGAGAGAGEGAGAGVGEGGRDGEGVGEGPPVAREGSLEVPVVSLASLQLDSLLDGAL